MRPTILAIVLNLVAMSTAWSQLGDLADTSFQSDLSGTHIGTWGSDSCVIVIKYVDTTDKIKLYQGYMQINTPTIRRSIGLLQLEIGSYGVKHFVEVKHADPGGMIMTQEWLGKNPVTVTRYVSDKGAYKTQTATITKMVNKFRPLDAGGKASDLGVRIYGDFTGNASGFGLGSGGIDVLLSIQRDASLRGLGVGDDEKRMVDALSGKKVTPPPVQ